MEVLVIFFGVPIMYLSLERSSVLHPVIAVTLLLGYIHR